MVAGEPTKFERERWSWGLPSELGRESDGRLRERGAAGKNESISCMVKDFG